MPVISLPPAIYRAAPATSPSVSLKHRRQPAERHVDAGPRWTPTAYYQTGIASWYGRTRHRTASGERYNPRGFTAAHRWLPLNTWIRVTDLKNGRSVTVRINDRGPYVRGRVLDLSAGAARILHMRASGLAPVRIEIVGQNRPEWKKPPPVARRGFDASSMAWADQTE